MAKVSAAEIITRHAKHLRKVRDHLTDLILESSVPGAPGELREVADAAHSVAEVYDRIRGQVAEVPGSIMGAILLDAAAHFEGVHHEYTALADQAAKRAGGTP